MGKRVALVLEDEALAIIEQNASERQRGEWVSGVIMAHAALRDVDASGALERLAARVSRLEDAIRELLAALRKA